MHLHKAVTGRSYPCRVFVGRTAVCLPCWRPVSYRPVASCGIRGSGSLAPIPTRSCVRETAVVGGRARGSYRCCT